MRSCHIRAGFWSRIKPSQSLNGSFQAAGSIQANRPFRRCIARCLRKLAGISPGPKDWGAFRRFVYMPEYDLWAEKICMIYTARPVLPHGPPTEPDHMPMIMEIGAAILTLANEGDRMFVSQWAGLA